MTESITPERIANAILMTGSSEKYYLLTEGAKDTALFGKFINKDAIVIKTAFGCTKLRKCIKILKDKGFSRYLGIIDSDFHRILNTAPDEDNLFIVDYHDIEVMMVKSRALDYIVKTTGCSEKLEKFEKDKGDSFLNLLLNSAKNIGYLRLANNINGLGLKFKPEKPEGKQIPYKDFINDDLSVKENDTMISRIMDYSRAKSSNLKDINEIRMKYQEVLEKEFDIYQLVNGHDITNILSLFFLKNMKCKNNLVATHNTIADSLILAYDISEFKKTDIYNDLKSWSTDNDVLFFV